MKKLLACLVLGSFVLLCAGCASTPQKGLIMARFHSIKPSETPAATDIFGPGEVPSAYVYGYDDNAVTIEIYDIATGALVKKQTSFIPKGKDYYLVLSDLPPGSYKAVISTNGTSRDMKLFKIQR
jgi:hypothetical protein